MAQMAQRARRKIQEKMEKGKGEKVKKFVEYFRADFFPFHLFRFSPFDRLLFF
jgi:hypothetical protein